MSPTQHPDATIPGLNGPYFPASTQALTALIADKHINWHNDFFTEALQECPGLQEVTKGPRSSDNYQWRTQITFAEGSSTIVVLLPSYEYGPEEDDGRYGDRSVAVYVKEPDTLGSDADAVVIRITQAFEALRDSQIATSSKVEA